MLYTTFDALLNTLTNDQYYRYNYTSKPKANIYKNENSYLIEMAVPGFSREDIEVTMENGALTVSVSTKINNKPEKSKDVSEYKEFDYSNFARSWTLPDGVDLDKIEATYEAGILKISIPTKDSKTVKKIKID